MNFWSNRKTDVSLKHQEVLIKHINQWSSFFKDLLQQHKKSILKGISLFITFFNPPGDVCLNNRRHFFPRRSIVPAAYCFCDIRGPLLQFLLNYLCICDNRIVCWAIILLENKTASCPDNTECRNVAKPINQHFSITAGPSWAAEGNNQSLDFRRSLFIMQSGTSPYTFHSASSSGEEEGHQQSLSNHCCWNCHLMFPSHLIILFLRLSQPSPQELTGTSGDEEAKILQIFLLRNKGKKCI